jgi:hypothetical protein
MTLTNGQKRDVRVSYKDVLPYFIKAEDFQMEEYADSGKLSSKFDL